MTKTNDDLDKDIRYLGVLFEKMLDQNKTILEVVGDMQQHITKIPQLQEDIHELKQDMRVVKAAVTDTNRELHELDKRVTQLEATA
jgi:septal ring factor EnvC (AmiA/AmiB activator)